MVIVPIALPLEAFTSAPATCKSETRWTSGQPPLGRCDLLGSLPSNLGGPCAVAAGLINLSGRAAPSRMRRQRLLRNRLIGNISVTTRPAERIKALKQFASAPRNFSAFLRLLR